MFALIFMLILNILSSLFGIKTLSAFITLKNSRWKKLLLLAGFWLLISMIIQVGDVVNLPPTFLIFMLCLFVSCDGPLMKKLDIGLIYSCTALSLSALADNYILTLLDLPSSIVRSLCLVVFWGIFYYIIRHNTPEKNYDLSPALWKLIFLLTLTPFGIVLAVIVLTAPYYYTDRANYNVYLFLLLLSFFSFVGLLRTITVLAKQQKLERQNMLLHANAKYYESIKEQQFEVRRLKHDLSNHLQVIYALPVSEKDNYIQQLLKTPVYAKTLHYSEDETVNAVISTKRHRIDEEHITFHAKIDIPRELPFEKTDTCALFANSLDNAIEACCRLPVEKRMILLEAGWRKNLFVLRVSNTSSTDAPLKDGLPATTKADKANHGFGLRSIQEIAERYAGSVEIDAKDGVFCLLLYLPSLSSF